MSRYKGQQARAHRMYKEGKTSEEISQWLSIKLDTIKIWVDGFIYDDYRERKRKEKYLPSVMDVEYQKNGYWKDEEEIERSFNPTYDPNELEGEERAIYEGRITLN